MIWVISILLILWLVFGLHHMLDCLKYGNEEEQ